MINSLEGGCEACGKTSHKIYCIRHLFKLPLRRTVYCSELKLSVGMTGANISSHILL